MSVSLLDIIHYGAFRDKGVGRVSWPPEHRCLHVRGDIAPIRTKNDLNDWLGADCWASYLCHKGKVFVFHDSYTDFRNDDNYRDWLLANDSLLRELPKESYFEMLLFGPLPYYRIRVWIDPKSGRLHSKAWSAFKETAYNTHRRLHHGPSADERAHYYRQEWARLNVEP
jgi:hypothetical protein